MTTQEPTVRIEDEPRHARTLAGVALALASGAEPGALEIDLADPAQRVFGAYTLVERIGAGGMGLVYRARQESLERDVAIKFLNLSFARDDAALERFRFEARSAAALNHPNIVQVIEIGQAQGLAFIAMQLVRGESLAERLRARRPSRAEAIALMLEICDAVSYAHRLGLLHLDLKPANVLIDERGEPLIADFGLARRMNAHGQVEAQEVSGTPGYMAPEQVLVKQFRLSAATDLYALGAILYELLCGEPPHGRGKVEDIMQRALAGKIAEPSSLDRSIPPDLEAICLKCLALRAGDRYENVAAFATDLRHHAEGLSVSVRTPTRLERVQRWYAREPRFALALAALVGLAIASSAMLARLYAQADREREAAEGLAQMIMADTGKDDPDILAESEGYTTPVADCVMVRSARCTDGIGDTFSRIDRELPPDQEARYLNSLRSYVAKIDAWGKPRLARQLDRKIQEATLSLSVADLLPAIAADESAEGPLFAYTLAPEGGEKVGNERRREWFELALARASEPWQLAELAESCDPKNEPQCVAAIDRYRELAPDNATAWLAGLADAPDDTSDRLLLRAAAAPRFQHYRAEAQLAAIAFARRFMPLQPLSRRIDPESFALEIGLYMVISPFPIRYCKASLATRAEPRIEQACREVFQKERTGTRPALFDEFFAALALYGMRKPGEAADAERRRYRNARWVYSTILQLPWIQSAPRAELLRRELGDGEWASYRDKIAEAGLPVEAPDRFVTREPLPWPRFTN